MSKKLYLGPGVYAQSDPPTGGVILTSNDSAHRSNRIYLNPSAIDKLEIFLIQLDLDAIALQRLKQKPT